MASQVRGSAIVTAVMAMGLCMVLHGETAHGETFTVGEGDGWNLKVHDWPNGKNFTANDTLVFKYNNAFHNVAVVDEIGFRTCTVGDKLFSSGNDEIKIQQGQNYFICGFPGHCAAGMKIAVTAK
ncbi:basic blue protein-like [Pyrus x bretschneideri]|uniref:basic blue protein-like n=1 Tax=Pyrus x bretschneideri TaxID=225117 RepID=UPI00202F23C0|nr:basic blue protein-like [Pyrus x bretschneideri]